MNLRPLPLGIPDFESLRSDGRIYADKTEAVCRLAAQRGKFSLARPRRFGKSLLLSTFESLFRSGTREFAGLAAEKLWADKTYRVLRLDFSIARSFSSKAEFLRKFDLMLSVATAQADFSIPRTAGDPIASLCLFIVSQPSSSLVLLIDEYDAPLTGHLDNPALFAEVQESLNALWDTVRSCTSPIRFFFMTGITKFTRTGVFSAFDDLTDISMDPEYGTILGFTEDEVRSCFDGYLQRAQEALGLGKECLLRELRSGYGGYCFDREASARVFCPWSVLRFLDSPKDGFADYWCKTGGQPAELMKYLAGHPMARPESFGEARQLPLSALEGASSCGDLKPEALMAQAGYLTIKAVTDEGFAVLGYPNAEVTASMARLYADEILKGRPWRRPEDRPVSEVLATCSLAEAAGLFDQAISAIDCKDFPVTNEAVCRSHIQILLFGARIPSDVERRGALGRSDLEFDAGERHWVLEFKYARNPSETDERLREGLEQIRTRRCGVSAGGKKLMRAAFVFDGSERRFTAFAEAAPDKGPADQSLA